MRLLECLAIATMLPRDEYIKEREKKALNI